MSAGQPPNQTMITGLGFTLIELLVTLSIIAVLAGLLVPAMFIVRESQARSRAASIVANVHMAVQMYAAEDSRHRFPTQGDGTLRWSPEALTAGNLNLMTDTRIELDLSGLDRKGPAPYVLNDPWGRPYHYQVDDDLRGASGAQRPLNLPAWNEAGKRPWAYVWSQGKADTADGSSWIYVKDTQ